MNVKLEISLPATPAFVYPVQIGAGLLTELGSWLPKNCSMVVIITDHTVKKLYATNIKKALSPNHKVLLLSFPPGEQSKNARTKMRLETRMLAQGCDRDTVIIALGGGVVGDLAGFIAATYMRGIAYIQIPTTLLAMVDSCVGGKTAIDTPHGKNLIGAFWQPKAVLADISCLNTLSTTQLINGLVEAVKMFLTSDIESLLFLERNLDKVLEREEAFLIDLIHRALQIKANIVKRDEKEKGQRMVLNFGHTIGHAIEQLTQYQILHGYAVGLGILLEAKIAELLSLLSAKEYAFIKNLLFRLGITSDDFRKMDKNQLIQCTKLDKKRKKEISHYVLLRGLGAVYSKDNFFAHPIDEEIVSKAFYATIQASE